MRTITRLLLLGTASMAVLAGCTVKDIDAPPLAGPSTLAHSIIMTAERDTLTQNGTDFTDIRIVSLGPDGRSESIPLRAQVFVDGVAQDFGTLSTKNPVTPTTIRYTAPPASTVVAGQTASTITIVVTPVDAGDARGEVSRQLDIRLEPFGVLVPVNPNLIAKFTFTPSDPRILDTVTFDASLSTNGGVSCGGNCSYTWNFGDGSTGTGVVTTHQFRAVNTYPVTLTVTDARGAQAFSTLPVPVGAGAPPTVTFTTSPEEPQPGQTIFFNASESKAAEGRVLVEYFWDFGDGATASGVAVTHSYAAEGTYVVTLKITDDARTFAVASQSITVEIP